MASCRIPLWVLLLLLSAAATTAGRPPKFRDPKQPVNIRIRSLLRRMTLAEKIGQMTMIERSVATPEVLKAYGIGGVLSGHGGSPPRPRASAKDWTNMVNQLQKGSLSSRLKIPILYGSDAVHGHSNAYNATIFPHNVGLGVTRDVELIKKIGNITAIEVRATGVNYVFAPSIAACADPRWGRCYESYGEDHKLVMQMTDIILGLQGIPRKGGSPFIENKYKVAACAKHFLADGATQNGTNEGNAAMNWRALMHGHMVVYSKAIFKGVSSIMVSSSSLNGVKMHANRELVTAILKEMFGFKGFVISDWQGIDKITSPPGSNYTHSVLASISAGLDMIMVPYDYQAFVSNLTYLVENKFIPISRIDDAVSRILRVKFSLGLFENPWADPSLASILGNQEHRNVAREAVRKSLVLLKNGKKPNEVVLPLPKKAPKILVAGTHADNLGYQCGGWTIEWQGVSGNNLTTGTTILSAIKSSVDPSTKVVFSEKPDANFVKSNGFSYAIVVVGETPYAETKGYSPNLTLPEPGPTTIQNVCGAVKCVVVLVTGRPVIVEPYLPSIDALVAAWLPGTEGKGVTDVLFGDFGFTGRLTMTWVKSADQLPMNAGARNYSPLFKLNTGLTTPAKAN